MKDQIIKEIYGLQMAASYPEQGKEYKKGVVSGYLAACLTFGKINGKEAMEIKRVFE